jgi:Na+/H+-dicarboxylate symporter
MEKKKKKLGLLPKLLIAIVLGLIVGFACQKFGEAGKLIIQIGATYNDIFGNFLNFCIPLIIIGFVVPGIADLGSGAGKTLAATTGVAYLSTIIAGSLAFIVDVTIFPSLVHADMFMADAQNAEETALSGLFTIEMPPIMGVMEALLISFILGLGLTFIKDDTLKVAIKDFSEIITKLVGGVVIPLLPIHVYGIFAKLTYAGTIVELMTSFVKVFVVILILHCVILIFQYTVAGTVAKKNPFGLIKNMIPAYTTAIGTQSSAATIPVTVECTKKNGVTASIAEFVCPLCATIHLSGSTITLTSCSIAVLMMMGQPVTFGKMFPFILMLGITMVAAPGVPGGAVMAALGILQSMLGFDETMQGLMIALYIAQDSFGTACNVTGDGAIAVFMDSITKKGKAKKEKANV